MLTSVKLTNMPGLGWMLLPTDAASSRHALAKLYNGEYDQLPTNERAFHKDQPLEEAVKLVRSVCDGLGMRMSCCGNREQPHIRLWWEEKIVVTEKFHIDLKYSLWTVDASTWNKLAPGMIEKIKTAWKGESVPIMIHTAPKKEVRYGTLTISKGRAIGHFRTEWDEPETLADTIDTKIGRAHV